MTREDIIRMAQEAGAIPIHKDYSQKALVGNENIERFATLVASSERDACAKVCDDWPNGRDDVFEIGKAIRARKTE